MHHNESLLESYIDGYVQKKQNPKAKRNVGKEIDWNGLID
jgi:hypothetical protein